VPRSNNPAGKKSRRTLREGKGKPRSLIIEDYPTKAAEGEGETRINREKSKVSPGVLEASFLFRKGGGKKKKAVLLESKGALSRS